MRKKIAIFVAGLIIGVVIGVFFVYPGIYAWTKHLNYFDTLYKLIVPIH